jgi:hypothetical protein
LPGLPLGRLAAWISRRINHVTAHEESSQLTFAKQPADMVMHPRSHELFQLQHRQPRLRLPDELLNGLRQIAMLGEPHGIKAPQSLLIELGHLTQGDKRAVGKAEIAFVAALGVRTPIRAGRSREEERFELDAAL